MDAVSEEPCLSRKVLEAVAASLGLDELGHTRLTLDFDDGVLHRWGPGSDPRNGTSHLRHFDADLRARLERVLAA